MRDRQKERIFKRETEMRRERCAGDRTIETKREKATHVQREMKREKARHVQREMKREKARHVQREMKRERERSERHLRLMRRSKRDIVKVDQQRLMSAEIRGKG